MKNNIRTITLPSLNGGLNTADPPYLIADNQSPDMLNVWYKNNALSKRYGQEILYSFIGPLIVPPFNDFMFAEHPIYSVSGIFNGCRIVHAGDDLYKWDGTSITEVFSREVYQKKGVFIEFGDDLYYIDGRKIWQIKYDYTVSEVTPYTPVVMINCRPDLSSSTDNEAYNLIGAGFTVKYNGDGNDNNNDNILEGSTVYKLPITNLDTNVVQVYINGTEITTGYNVVPNVTNNATVTFTTPPPAGTNNVWITAYKTQYEKNAQGEYDTSKPIKNRILKCTIGMAYGGESSALFGGTRVFLSGNAEYPFHYWRSDLGGQGAGMSYFPDTSEELLDQNPEPITAMAKIANQLVIFKTNSIFSVGYSFDGKDAYYPVAECQSTIGCDMPGSIQLIDNRLVFGNTRHGIMMLISTSGTLENNVKPLSANINAQLLKEPNLESACSADFERYYWLCVNGFVYLWDYDTTPYYNYSDYDVAQQRLAWYKFDNINAAEFVSDTALYYFAGAKIIKFIPVRNDFGKAYKGYVKTKAFDLGEPHICKIFKNVYPSFSSDGDVKAEVMIGNEKREEVRRKTFDFKTFGWDQFNWGTFGWGAVKFAKTYLMRTDMKDSAYIQIKIESNEKDRGLGLTGVRVDYLETKPIRRMR